MMNSCYNLLSCLGFLVFLYQSNLVKAFNCDFESGTCGFIQSNNDQFDWTRKSGSSVSPITGPQNGDHTSGTGYFMFIDVSGRTRGDKAVLQKSISATNKNCLEFYYHMYSKFGSMGDLNVYVDGVKVFHLSGSQGNIWTRGKINFNTTSSHLVAFEATKNDDNVGEIAIDDIKTYTCHKPENVTLSLETSKPSYTFLVGETLFFTCQSSAEPTPCRISFTFPGYEDSKPVESKNCSARFHLLIDGCGPAKLSCQVKNGEGTGSTSLMLTIQKSPTADIQSRPSYFEGAKVQIFCTAHGCPVPNVSWKRQGAVGLIKQGVGFTILDYANIAVENAGVYTCTSENGAVGSPVSNTITVVVHHVPKNVQLTTNATNNLVLQGETVNVTCSALANPTPCTFTIYWKFTPVFKTTSASCSVSYNLSAITGCAGQVLMCAVSNSVGSAPNVVKNIFVQVPPQKLSTIPEGQNNIFEGASLSMTCSATGCPDPILTWTKSGVEEPLRRGNQSSLIHVFERMGKENTGLYNCTADNGVLDPVTTSVYINVLYKPRSTRITTNRSSNIFLQGESVAFTCLSEANPMSCTVKLSRNGKELSVQTKADCSLNHVVENIQGCNDVPFECEASNTAGEGVATTKTITVQVPAVISLAPAGSTVVKQEGSSLSLTCTAVGCPTPNVTWVKVGSGTLLAQGNGSVEYTFDSLRIEDAGTYRCDADNGIIGRSFFNIIAVNVTYQPKNTQLTTNRVGDVVLVGELVEFTCSSLANPGQCAVVFQKGNVVLDTINSNTCTAKYVWKNMKGCNLERFSCFATNVIGEGPLGYKNVTVQVPVKISISPVNDTLIMKEGSSLDLVCNATGCPTPKITWKNARHSSPYLETTGYNLAHNFTSVQKTHMGHHICIVDNGIAGSPVNRSIFVNITYGPSIKTLPRNVAVNLYENDQVDLTCEVDSNPPAVTVWNKDNSNSIIARGERLTLPAERSTSGTYTCTATNGYGLTKKVAFTVQVKACLNNKCTFNTTCISRGTTYYCDCPKGLTGRLCDELDPFKDQFTVTLYIVNIAWTEDYKDTGSPAYKLVEDRICWEMQRLFVNELAKCELVSLRKGSVISETRLTLKQDKYRSEVIGVIKAETVNDTLGPLILDQSALITRVEAYSSFCGDQPCQFDGTCYEQGDGYRCDCKLFRFGTQCEKGIGFIPGVAVIVIGSILLVVIICLIAYCWKRAKRGSFAKGSAEVKANMSPEKQTRPDPENHPLSVNNVYVSVEQEDKDEEQTNAEPPEPKDPFDEATKL